MVTCLLGDVPITSPHEFPIGVSTVVCTASNRLGVETCSFNVTVVDSGKPPVFKSFPGDIKVSNDAGQCSAMVKFTVTASGDPAPVVTCMLDDMPITSPFEFPKGVSTVICTASNVLGVATRKFEVTVKDREAPSVTVEPTTKNDVVRLLSTDNCDPDPHIFVRDSASSFVAGPFHNGDIVKIIIKSHATPEQRETGPAQASIILRGAPLIVSIDADKNCGKAELGSSYSPSSRRAKWWRSFFYRRQ